MNVSEQLTGFHALHAERILVAGAVLDPNACRAAGVDARDFVHPAAGQLWTAMCSLESWSSAYDLAVRAAPAEPVQAKLVAYLEECEVTGGRPRDVPEFATIVRRFAVTREILQAVSMAHRHIEAGLLGAELADVLVAEIASVRGRLRRQESRPMTELVERMITRVEAEPGDSESSSYVPIGLRRLDEATGGWQGGVVSVVAARTSHGKSAFLFQCALHAASLGIPVHLLSAEDLESDTGWRALGWLAQMPASVLRRHRALDGATRDRVAALRGELTRSALTPIRITPASGLTAPQAVAHVRMHQGGDRTALVMFDYLQRLPTASGADRYETLRRAMDTFDLAAKADGLPWVIASQVKRGDGGEKTAPTLGDLRGAGEIGEDAKLVLGLHRPRKGRGALDDAIRIEVLKASNDELVVGDFRWDGPLMRVLDEEPLPC